ncbi:hypothetical protein FNF31_05441 [Cafeteria roenbergensis]|uniref:Calponin-homology (CH) domain-containing protein n=1 Tax=Cafeteria roenbergensis TaxID=33653 RepID=A0A5A8D316_CAFRO|nr:hypothetical protein FNF31_05441 [Cafeteria roenbergensis]
MAAPDALLRWSNMHLMTAGINVAGPEDFSDSVAACALLEGLSGRSCDEVTGFRPMPKPRLGVQRQDNWAVVLAFGATLGIPVAGFRAADLCKGEARHVWAFVWRLLEYSPALQSACLDDDDRAASLSPAQQDAELTRWARAASAHRSPPVVPPRDFLSATWRDGRALCAIIESVDSTAVSWSDVLGAAGPHGGEDSPSRSQQSASANVALALEAASAMGVPHGLEPSDFFKSSSGAVAVTAQLRALLAGLRLAASEAEAAKAESELGAHRAAELAASPGRQHGSTQGSPSLPDADSGQLGGAGGTGSPFLLFPSPPRHRLASAPNGPLSPLAARFASPSLGLPSPSVPLRGAASPFARPGHRAGRSSTASSFSEVTDAASLGTPVGASPVPEAPGTPVLLVGAVDKASAAASRRLSRLYQPADEPGLPTDGGAPEDAEQGSPSNAGSTPEADAAAAPATPPRALSATAPTTPAPATPPPPPPSHVGHAGSPAPVVDNAAVHLLRALFLHYAQDPRSAAAAAAAATASPRVAAATAAEVSTQSQSQPVAQSQPSKWSEMVRSAAAGSATSAVLRTSTTALRHIATKRFSVVAAPVAFTGAPVTQRDRAASVALADAANAAPSASAVAIGGRRQSFAPPSSGSNVGSPLPDAADILDDLGGISRRNSQHPSMLHHSVSMGGRQAMPSYQRAGPDSGRHLVSKASGISPGWAGVAGGPFIDTPVTDDVALDDDSGDEGGADAGGPAAGGQDLAGVEGDFPATTPAAQQSNQRRGILAPPRSAAVEVPWPLPSTTEAARRAVASIPQPEPTREALSRAAEPRVRGAAAAGAVAVSAALREALAQVAAILAARQPVAAAGGPAATPRRSSADHPSTTAGTLRAAARVGAGAGDVIGRAVSSGARRADFSRRRSAAATTATGGGGGGGFGSPTRPSRAASDVWVMGGASHPADAFAMAATASPGRVSSPGSRRPRRGMPAGAMSPGRHEAASYAGSEHASTTASARSARRFPALDRVHRQSIDASMEPATEPSPSRSLRAVEQRGSTTGVRAPSSASRGGASPGPRAFMSSPAGSGQRRLRSSSLASSAHSPPDGSSPGHRGSLALIAASGVVELPRGGIQSPAVSGHARGGGSATEGPPSSSAAGAVSADSRPLPSGGFPDSRNAGGFGRGTSSSHASPPMLGSPPLDASASGLAGLAPPEGAALLVGAQREVRLPPSVLPTARGRTCGDLTSAESSAHGSASGPPSSSHRRAESEDAAPPSGHRRARPPSPDGVCSVASSVGPQGTGLLAPALRRAQPRPDSAIHTISGSSGRFSEGGPGPLPQPILERVRALGRRERLDEGDMTPREINERRAAEARARLRQGRAGSHGSSEMQRLRASSMPDSHSSTGPQEGGVDVDGMQEEGPDAGSPPTGPVSVCESESMVAAALATRAAKLGIPPPPARSDDQLATVLSAPASSGSATAAGCSASPKARTDRLLGPGGIVYKVARHSETQPAPMHARQVSEAHTAPAISSSAGLSATHMPNTSDPGVAAGRGDADFQQPSRPGALVGSITIGSPLRSGGQRGILAPPDARPGADTTPPSDGSRRSRPPGLPLSPATAGHGTSPLSGAQGGIITVPTAGSRTSDGSSTGSSRADVTSRSAGLAANPSAALVRTARRAHAALSGFDGMSHGSSPASSTGSGRPFVDTAMAMQSAPAVTGATPAGAAVSAVCQTSASGSSAPAATPATATAAGIAAGPASSSSSSGSPLPSRVIVSRSAQQGNRSANPSRLGSPMIRRRTRTPRDLAVKEADQPKWQQVLKAMWGPKGGLVAAEGERRASQGYATTRHAGRPQGRGVAPRAAETPSAAHQRAMHAATVVPGLSDRQRAATAALVATRGFVPESVTNLRNSEGVSLPAPAGAADEATPPARPVSPQPDSVPGRLWIMTEDGWVSVADADRTRAQSGSVAETTAAVLARSARRRAGVAQGSPAPAAGRGRGGNDAGASAAARVMERLRRKRDVAGAASTSVVSGTATSAALHTPMAVLPESESAAPLPSSLSPSNADDTEDGDDDDEAASSSARSSLSRAAGGRLASTTRGAAQECSSGDLSSSDQPAGSLATPAAVSGATSSSGEANPIPVHYAAKATDGRSSEGASPLHGTAGRGIASGGALGGAGHDASSDDVPAPDGGSSMAPVGRPAAAGTQAGSGQPVPRLNSARLAATAVKAATGRSASAASVPTATDGHSPGVRAFGSGATDASSERSPPHVSAALGGLLPATSEPAAAAAAATITVPVTSRASPVAAFAPPPSDGEARSAEMGRLEAGSAAGGAPSAPAAASPTLATAPLLDTAAVEALLRELGVVPGLLPVEAVSELVAAAASVAAQVPYDCAVGVGRGSASPESPESPGILLDSSSLGRVLAVAANLVAVAGKGGPASDTECAAALEALLRRANA